MCLWRVASFQWLKSNSWAPKGPFAKPERGGLVHLGVLTRRVLLTLHSDSEDLAHCSPPQEALFQSVAPLNGRSRVLLDPPRPR